MKRRSTAPSKDQRLLVVDDEESLRILFSMALAGKGVTVETSGDGYEALEAVRRDAFDLILLDLRMPRLDGSEFLKQLRIEGNSSRVIVCSAELDARVVAELIPLGVVTFLSKPLSLVTFRETVVGKLTSSGASLRAKALRLAERQQFSEASALLSEEKETSSAAPHDDTADLWRSLFSSVAAGFSGKSILPYVRELISRGCLIH
ncbi:response regulator [Haloferula chungangensis]|uniref:Response regulator n=1 Tax=Haloferula chungangensis TaxID=1048331 RepID=A0ABW2L5M8_9BACT